MEDYEASIEWYIGKMKLSRQLHVPDGKVLLSLHYLQSLLPPSFTFKHLQAIVQIGEEYIHIPVPPLTDMEGHQHFTIDTNLSQHYLLESDEHAIYVSDSKHEEDLFESQIHDFETEVECLGSPRSKDVEQKIDAKGILIDSSEDELVLAISQSMVSLICDCSGSYILKDCLQESTGPVQVLEIPMEYNGNIVFELPAMLPNESKMKRMEQRFDGHIWTRPCTTNMAIDCTVRLSYCLGVLKCVLELIVHII